MTEATRKSRPPRRKRRGPAEPDQSEYQRRFRAAGLHRDETDSDEPPQDMDAFRDGLARRIVMLINDWKGCPEKRCRRQRGCMAPHSRCTNQPWLPPDPDAAANMLAEFRRALEARSREDGQ